MTKPIKREMVFDMLQKWVFDRIAYRFAHVAAGDEVPVGNPAGISENYTIYSKK